MTELVLKKIGKPFGAAPCLEKEDDFLVLNNTGRVHRPDCEARPLTKGAAMGLDNYCTRITVTAIGIDDATRFTR
jgi:hypothetical protein